MKHLLCLMILLLTTTEITLADDDLAQLKISATKTDVLDGRLLVLFQTKPNRVQCNTELCRSLKVIPSRQE